MRAFETLNPRSHRQQVSTVQQHDRAECHHQSLASSSKRECECYLYSGGEDPRFLIPIFPLESYVVALAQESLIVLKNIRAPGFD